MGGLELACEERGGWNWNGGVDGCGDGCGNAVEAVSSGRVLESWDSTHRWRVRSLGSHPITQGDGRVSAPPLSAVACTRWAYRAQEDARGRRWSGEWRGLDSTSEKMTVQQERGPGADRSCSGQSQAAWGRFYGGYLLGALDAVLMVAVIPVQQVPPILSYLCHPRWIPPAVAVSAPHSVPDLVGRDCREQGGDLPRGEQRRQGGCALLRGKSCCRATRRR
jgi:hypothetical protein